MSWPSTDSQFGSFSKPKRPLSTKLSPKARSRSPKILKPRFCRSRSKGSLPIRPSRLGSSGSSMPNRPKSSPGSSICGSFRRNCSTLSCAQSTFRSGKARSPSLTSGQSGSSWPKSKLSCSPCKFSRGSANRNSGRLSVAQSICRSGKATARSGRRIVSQLTLPKSGSVRLTPGRLGSRFFSEVSKSPRLTSPSCGSVRLGSATSGQLTPGTVGSFNAAQSKPNSGSRPDRSRSKPGMFSRGSANTSSGSVRFSQSSPRSGSRAVSSGQVSPRKPRSMSGRLRSSPGRLSSVSPSSGNVRLPQSMPRSSAPSPGRLKLGSEGTLRSRKGKDPSDRSISGSFRSVFSPLRSKVLKLKGRSRRRSSRSITSGVTPSALVSATSPTCSEPENPVLLLTVATITPPCRPFRASLAPPGGEPTVSAVCASKADSTQPCCGWPCTMVICSRLMPKRPPSS